MNAGTAADKSQKRLLELTALSLSVTILGLIRGRFSDHRRSSAMKRQGALPFDGVYARRHSVRKVATVQRESRE